MTDRACSIGGCDRPVQARGWCVMHWGRWKRNGDPERLVDKAAPLHERAGAPPGMCTVPGCDRKLRARGVCVTHYQRWRDTGDVNANEPVRILGDDEARFWANIDKRGTDDCWHWTGTIDKAGYGRFGGPEHLAHRWSCKHFNGPVADDQHVDHVCHNRDRSCVRGPSCLHRRCVNPAHLEAVAPQDNTFRAYGATKAACRAGHPRNEENASVNSVTGKVQCRPCQQKHKREYEQRKRARLRSTSARVPSASCRTAAPEPA